MRATVQLARDGGVAIGAHPGFPDAEGFGRRELQFSPRDVEDFVVYQVGALAAIAAAEGVRLQHVKPHGALFNMAARDPALADAIARAAAVIDATLILFGPPGSELAGAATRSGLRFAAEGFADRSYHPDGRLVSREQAGAVIHDPDIVVRRATRIIREQTVEALVEAIRTFEAAAPRFEPKALRARAELFDRPVFAQRLLTYVEARWQEFRARQAC